MNVGFKAQNQLMNQLTPIDHLGNMIQYVNILVTSLMNRLPQNVPTMVPSGNPSVIRPNGRENVNGFNQSQPSLVNQANGLPPRPNTQESFYIPAPN